MLISDRKTGFREQYRSGNCILAFGIPALINKMKKDNKVGESSVEAAAASTSIPSASLLRPRSSTARTTRSSNENTKQFQQICFVYNEIRPYNSIACNKGVWGVLIDAANGIGAANDLYVAKQRLIIYISGELKDIFSRNQIPLILLQSIYLQKT